MLNTKIYITLFALIAVTNSWAAQKDQENLRTQPDSSNTVYMTSVPSGMSKSELEAAEKETLRNYQNQTKKDDRDEVVSEGRVKSSVSKTKKLKQAADGGVLNNLKATPYVAPQAKVQAQSKYAGNELDTHILAISANCLPLKSAGSKGMAVVDLGDYFFAIPTKPKDLPPFPAGGGKVGVHGIDKNQNCVRDDIEHYVFNKYPRKTQEQLRLNLYKHSIWLNFFLIKPISDKSIQGISRQDIKTGRCIDSLIGEEAGVLARGDLFAHQHNTDERTNRYFENMEVLRGFMIEEDISGPCA